MNKRKSIVWNLTRRCAWDCEFCCVGAIKLSKCINTNGNKEQFNDELNFNEKLQILHKLDHEKYCIDFSGGEIFIDKSNVDLIIAASQLFGKENVSLSSSGAYLTDEIIEILRSTINDIELTLDTHPDQNYSLRPSGYHNCAARAIKKLKNSGITVGVQTVLTKNNIDFDSLINLYNWLESNNVDKWSLLRFFPSGRGAQKFDNLVPSHKDYCDTIEMIKSFSANSRMDVHFQYLLPNHEGYTNECRCVKKSLGILPNGNVTSCFWAIDQNMSPIDNKFLLGNLHESNFDEIMNSDNAKYWLNNKHSCEVLEYYE